MSTETENRENSKLQQYMDSILLNTPIMLLVFDIKGKAVLASEAYKRHSNAKSLDEIYGKTFSELLGSVSTDVFRKNVDFLLVNASAYLQPGVIEQDIDFGRNGKKRSYIIQITPMLHNKKSTIGTMVVFHDVTEIIKARHEAEQAKEHAEQSAHVKSEFLARMTHEMRTPMNAIVGMTAIGVTSKDIEKKDYAFQVIGDASTHLLGVINDILDMSKIEANKMELCNAEFDLRNMLEQVRNLFAVQIMDKKQTLVIDIDPMIPETLIADEQHLAQIMTNLLSNAVKFTPVEGFITISVNKKSEENGICTLTFSVKDSGIGILKQQQTQLFNSFEQAGGSVSRKYGGTGLGLAITKSIIDIMGGDIWIESEPGKGATFTFEIKAQIATTSKQMLSCCKQKNTILESSGIFNGKQILIAEDVEINRDIISELLKNSGVAIDFAHNGEEVVEKFTSSPRKYGLIFMDVQMPEMDGYEATIRIRSSNLPESKTIPIIAMTANVFRDDVERCMEVGMNGHLGKPVDISEVMSMLKEHLLGEVPHSSSRT